MVGTVSGVRILKRKTVQVQVQQTLTHQIRKYRVRSRVLGACDRAWQRPPIWKQRGFFPGWLGGIKTVTRDMIQIFVNKNVKEGEKIENSLEAILKVGPWRFVYLLTTGYITRHSMLGWHV